MIQIIKFKLTMWKVKKIMEYICNVFETDVHVKYEDGMGFFFTNHSTEITPFTGEDREITTYSIVDGVDVIRDINNHLYKNKLYLIWYRKISIFKLFKLKHRLALFRDTIYKSVYK